MLLFTTNHRVIGFAYFAVSFLSGLTAFVLSLELRIELGSIGSCILFGDYQLFNSLTTAHGLLMIFAFIVPFFTGFLLNSYGPSLIGVPDMIFPRMNNLSIILYRGFGVGYRGKHWDRLNIIPPAFVL